MKGQLRLRRRDLGQDDFREQRARQLDAGLKLIESRKLLPVHSSLLKSWGALYGFTSDAGIRHGMQDGQPAVALEDALYLVVTCSSIVSYLISLAHRARLKLSD